MKFANSKIALQNIAQRKTTALIAYEKVNKDLWIGKKLVRQMRVKLMLSFEISKRKRILKMLDCGMDRIKAAKELKPDGVQDHSYDDDLDNVCLTLLPTVFTPGHCTWDDYVKRTTKILKAVHRYNKKNQKKYESAERKHDKLHELYVLQKAIAKQYYLNAPLL